MNPVDGAVLLDKPVGVSSFKALGPVKRALRGSKVGHTGTLDPFASGLLVALCGRLTKLAGRLTDLDKTYEAVFEFGRETDTLDPEGTLVAEGELPSFDRIAQEIKGFSGTISQRPPAYSAVHIDGKRAYERARSGETVELPLRRVSVRALEVIGWEPPDLRVRMTVSSGTYVRSIARDLGYACGSVAYVRGLRRISVGRWQVSDAIAPEEFSPDRHVISASRTVSAVPGLLRGVVTGSAAERICNGVPLRREWFRLDGETEVASDQSHEDIALFDDSGELLAVVAGEQEGFSYRFVRPRQ